MDYLLKVAGSKGPGFGEESESLEIFEEICGKGDQKPQAPKTEETEFKGKECHHRRRSQLQDVNVSFILDSFTPLSSGNTAVTYYRYVSPSSGTSTGLDMPIQSCPTHQADSFSDPSDSLAQPCCAEFEKDWYASSARA